MKKIFIAALTLILLSTIVGCTDQEGTAPGEGKNPSGENGSIKVVGEIVSFEKGRVHIITGDIVDIFQVAEENMKDFYLGETVGVKKLGEDRFELEKYEIKDFSTRHNTMGNLILTAIGEIKEIDDNGFTLATKDGDFEFETHDRVVLEEGTRVSVDYMEFGQESKRIFLDMYNEDTKLDLIVKEISRAEDGMMVVGAEDDQGLQYMVKVTRGTVLNFNHSDLKKDDRMTVYAPEVMLAIYPAEIPAKMIKK